MNRKRQSVNAVIRNRTLDTKYLKLKDVARFSSAKTTDICLESYISTENMIPFLGGVSTASSVPDVKSASFYEEGDILLSNIRLYFCKIWKADKKGACSNDVLVVKPKNNIDPTFLYYCLCDKNFFNYADLTSKGTKMPRGTKSAIMKYLVPNIPLCTQNIIASILSNYDKLIQNYKKQIEDLQNIASELYKEWFVRFRFPGHEKATFENGIPVGWKYEKLETYADISTGKCNREDAEEDGLFPLFDRSQEIKKSNSWIKDCEAIIVPGEGTSFIPRYFKGKFNLHQRCYCVEPKQENMGKFLFFLLMLNRHYFLSVATGATVPSLRYNNFAKMKFLLPNIDLCFKFNSIADCIFERIVNLQKQYDNLSTQRDYLLPRLMSGKLEVK